MSGTSGDPNSPIDGSADGFFLCNQCIAAGKTVSEKFAHLVHTEDEVRNGCLFYSNWKYHEKGSDDPAH